ncbi:MAG: diguanylate cyclase [Gammaproteobacteria bacterium]|nr:diguanylate cyclase [Gammaproteobacteria bacterium]
MNEPTSPDASLELNRHIVNLLDSLSALYGVTEISISEIGEKELLKKALESLMQNQDMERCSIFLLDDNNLLYNAAGRDWDDLLAEFTRTPAKSPAPQANNTFALGEGLMGLAAQSGQIEHCQSIATNHQFKHLSSEIDQVHGSIICVPIKSEGEILGVLNVSYPEDNYFDMWHERLLQLFCQMVGRIIINHRLFHHMDEQVNLRTIALNETNQQLQEKINERDRVQQELSRQHNFLQSVIDANAEPMMVIGKDYRVQYMNQSAIRASGIDSELTGRTCYEISHHRETPCDGVDHPCPLNMVIESGNKATVIHEHFKADGTPRHVELLASPFISTDGEIGGIIESVRDVTDRLNKEKILHRRHRQFKHQAHHDHLTGLPNRLFFNLELERMVKNAENDNRLMALLFLDLDGFKSVNDQYGHNVGDELLKHVAQRLKNHIRENDIAARIAGDEFTVLLNQLSRPEDAGLTAEKLVNIISEPYHIESHEVSISISIGIGLYPLDSREPTQLMTFSDKAMYQAKENGKHSYCYYSLIGKQS